MKLDRFLTQRQPSWAELTSLVASAAGRPERLGPDGVRRLGELYREAAADLAYIRRAWPSGPESAALQDLVAQARALVYNSESDRDGSPLGFFAHDYWRLLATRPAFLLVAWALLLTPALLTAVWALDDPGAAGGLVPAAYRSVTEPRTPGASLGLGAGEGAALSSTIFINNIRVSLVAFAGGIAAGLGTAFVLITNGVLLGTVTGLAFGAGNGSVLVELITPHGVLELSCIAVCAAAGLRLGWAPVRPGRRRRVDALVAEARPAVLMLLGTLPWLVVAGIVEGFITPAGLGLVPAVAIGLSLGALFWGLAWWRGLPGRSRALEDGR